MVVVGGGALETKPTLCSVVFMLFLTDCQSCHQKGALFSHTSAPEDSHFRHFLSHSVEANRSSFVAPSIISITQVWKSYFDSKITLIICYCVSSLGIQSL